MYSIKELRKSIDYQAAIFHPTVLNTLAVATLLYPPQLAWFADNGAYPYQSYHNQIEKIDWLNTAIKEDNTASGIIYAPSMHTFGVRTDKKKWKDRYGQVRVRHVKSHRWGEWREQDKSRMLHLNNKIRVKMGKTVGRYFAICTEVTRRS